MRRKAEVHNNGVLAGTLEKTARQQYIFRYDDHYFVNPAYSSIIVSMPKTSKELSLAFFVSFFYGLISEGVNRQIQCRLLQIDEKNHFSLLLATAQTNQLP